MQPHSDSGSSPIRTPEQRAPDRHPADNRAPGQADEHGVVYWPGDEEAHRAPGTVLVLLILSFVVGGLYVWGYWPLMAGFDWLDALTLKSSMLAVVGGAVMFFGGFLFIRHGLIWAVRFGSVVAAVPMTRLLVDSVVDTGGANIGPALLTYVLAAGPALLVLLLSFLPVVTNWRRRRQQYVAGEHKKQRQPRQ